MLIHMAVADAYAVAWEFVNPEDRYPNDWSGYRQHPTAPGARASFFTDDTLRSLINARVLLRREHLSPLAYVRQIKRAFRADKRGGWSRKFRAFMEEQLPKPDERWLAELKPRNTNGALMGAGVMGMLPNPDEAYAAGFVQAIVTHDHEAASYAACLSWAASGLAGGFTTRNGLLRWVNDKSDLAAMAVVCEGRSCPVDMSARMTFAAIIRILCEERSMTGIIDAAIGAGGDTDSVAAAAVCLASLAPRDYANDLPAWAFSQLEGGDRGMQQELFHTDSLLKRLRD